MTNHRRRMQTRSRRIGYDVPYGNWPENHNERVALRKRLRNLNRAGRQAARDISRLAAAFAALGGPLA